jgi:hypothetical protein
MVFQIQRSIGLKVPMWGIHLDFVFRILVFNRTRPVNVITRLIRYRHGEIVAVFFFFKGNLYFLNVKDEDGQKQYLCNALSRRLNVIRRGMLTQLQVIPFEPVNKKPMLLWNSNSTQVLLKGQNITLKCIYAGLPTPDVIWRKVIGTIPNRRSTIDGKKQELIIHDLQFEDAGTYQCRGQNGKYRRSFLRRTTLVVHFNLVRFGF